MKNWKKIMIGIGGLFIILLVWAFIEPYTISIEEEETLIPNLHQEWNGEKIAVISDFQLGLWMDNDGVLPKMVEEILESKPSIVLILGDFVYHSAVDHKIEMRKVIDI